MTLLEGRRILVVDDDRDTLDVECLMLQQQGCKVVCVENVEAAFLAMRKAIPDLVITDCAMPGEDGFDLLHRLKAQPDYQSIPTMMITAHVHSELRDRALREGFDAVLAKPIEPARLITAAEELIAP